MITLALRELIPLAQSGALGRLFALSKAVAISWANRNQGPSVDSELKAYDDRRLGLLRDHGATLPDGVNEYQFPDDEAKSKFAAAHAELLEQIARIEGDPVPIACMICDSLPTTEDVLKAVVGPLCNDAAARALGKFIKD